MAQREELILDVTAKLDQATRDVQALQAQIDALAAGTEATVTVAVEGKEDVEALAETTGALDGTAAEVTVEADDQATDTIDEVTAGVGDLDGASAEVAVEADDEATDVVEEVAEAVEDIDGTTAEIEVEADTSEATAGLEGLTESLGAMSTASGGALESLTALAGPAGVIAAVGAGFTAAFTAAVDFTGQVEELSLLTGAATEESSKLLGVLQDFTDIELSELSGLIQRVVDKFIEMPDLAQRLNVNPALPPLQQFVGAVDALNSGTLTASERIALGMDIFGRRGVKAVNEIAASLEGPLADAMEGISAERIIDEDDIARADELEAAMGELNDQLAAVAVKLGEQVIPLMTQMAEIGGPAAKGFGLALGGMMKFFEPAFTAVENFKAAWESMTEEDLTAADFGGGDFAADIDVVSEAAITYAEALELGQKAGADFVAEQDRMTFTSRELADAVQALQDPLETMPFLWDILIKKYREGTIESGTAEAAINQLAEATGKEPGDILKIVADEADKATEKALDLAEAMVDLKDTMAEIDTDDLSNIRDALEEALDVGGMDVSLQVEEAKVRGQVDEIANDIQAFVDEHGAVDWSVVLDPTKSAKGFDAGLAQMIGSLQEQLQTGIVNAFESGGTDAAMGFVNEFMPMLRELGMDTAQIREFMGIPPDGNIPVFLQVLMDAEAKADALAILDSLAGVDPSNPVVAYMRLAVQTGDIPPQIAEIAARILAADALNVPAKLEEFSQADVDAALAVLTGYGVTVPVTVDDEGTVQDFTTAADTATEDRDAHVIVPKSPSLGQMEELLNAVAREREVAFNAKSDNAGTMDRTLDAVAAGRIAHYDIVIDNLFAAKSALDKLDDPRYAHVYVVTHGAAGGGSAAGGAVPQAAGLAAPTAGLMTAPMTAEGELGVAALAAPAVISPTPLRVEVVNQTPAAAPSVTIQAGMIGNRNELDRMVSRAMRRHARLNGSRS